MGLETICRATGPSGSGEGRLLLETDELIFRGPARVRIPLASITKARVAGGDLVVEYPGGSIRFALGAVAAKWLERISTPPKSRTEKMGLKAGQVVSIVGLTERGFAAEAEALGARVSRGRVLQGSHHVIFEVSRLSDLAKLKTLRSALDPSGGIWVVHRKGPTGIKDTEIFAVAKRIGLTAVKVARFSETHTAERLVIPKALR